MTDEELCEKVREAADACSRDNPDDVAIIMHMAQYPDDVFESARRRFVDAVWNLLGKEFPVTAVTVGELAKWIRVRMHIVMYGGSYLRGWSPEDAQKALEGPSK